MKKTTILAVSLALLALPALSAAQYRLSAAFVIQRGKQPAMTLNYDIATLTNVLGSGRSIGITSFAGVSDRAVAGIGLTHWFRFADNARMQLGLGYQGQAGEKLKPVLMVGWSIK